ncbi:MAG: hypothetical protein M9933_14110 [Chitinophagaceae bacterium]|nr:hypothetical protein [Chitinophagaceae bacterium]
MTDQQTFITSCCAITPRGAKKDGKWVLENKEGEGADLFLASVYQHLGVDYPKFYKMDHLCQLGFLSVELLLNGRQIASEYGPENVGFVFSNANSSLDADLRYFESVKNIPSPAQFVYTLPNIVIGELSIRHGCKGENAFFVSESFDVDLLWFYVQDLISRRRLQACICGWIDCLDDDFKALVYLVESRTSNTELPFDTERICKIYNES